MKTYTSFAGYRTVVTTLALIFTLFFTGCSSSSDSSGSTPDFTASDMEGNWSLHAISFGLGNMDDGNVHGSLVMDSAGAVISGSFVGSDGQAAPLTGGTIAINDAGEIDGTIIATVTGFGDLDITVNNGKIDPSKNIMVWTDISLDLGSMDMGAAIKQGGTFATSDLAGTWYMFGPSVNGGALGSPEGTMRGSFELDANGSVVSGDISTSPDDMNMSTVGGAIVINSAGEINGTLIANVAGFGDFNVTVNSGKMDPSKNIIFMVDQTAFGSNELIAAVKSGGTFATSDMEGKWYTYGVSTGGALGKQTITGSIEQDASGKVTDGSLSFIGELSGLQPVLATIIPGGTLALNGSGELSGLANATIHTPTGDVNSTMTILSGKMAPSKNMSIWVFKTDDGQDGFVISVKGN